MKNAPVTFAIFLLLLSTPAFSGSSISPFRADYNVTVGKPFDIEFIIANTGKDANFALTLAGTAKEYGVLLDGTSVNIPEKSSKRMKLRVILPTEGNATEYYAEIIAKRDGAFSGVGSTGGVGIETSISAIYKLNPVAKVGRQNILTQPVTYFGGLVILVLVGVVFVLLRVFR